MIGKWLEGEQAGVSIKVLCSGKEDLGYSELHQYYGP